MVSSKGWLVGIAAIQDVQHGTSGVFTIAELVEKTKVLLDKGFSSSHAGQMLLTLTGRGLIYRHQFGKYSFAVPLMADFILRNYDGPGSG